MYLYSAHEPRIIFHIVLYIFFPDFATVFSSFKVKLPIFTKIIGEICNERTTKGYNSREFTKK